MSISEDPKKIDSTDDFQARMAHRPKLQGHALTVFNNTTTDEMKVKVYDLNEATLQHFMMVKRTMGDPESEEFKEVFESMMIRYDLKYDENGGIVSGFTTNYIDPHSVLTQTTEGLGYRTNRQKLTPFVEKALEQILVQINSTDIEKNFDKESVTISYTDEGGAVHQNQVTMEVRVKRFLIELSKLCNPSYLDNRYEIVTELYTNLVQNIVDLGDDLKEVDFEFLKKWFEVHRNRYKELLKEQYQVMYDRHALTVDEVLPLKRTVSYKTYREPFLIRTASINRDSAQLELMDTIYKIKLLEAL